MTKDRSSLEQKKYISKKNDFLHKYSFTFTYNSREINVIKWKKMESGFILLGLRISYWRAMTIAPIKAAKRIIEMSSNGRKKSVDK